MARSFGAVVNGRAATASSNSRERRTKSTPGIDALERRQLLTFFQPYRYKFDEIRSGGAAYVISVDGPGAVKTTKTRGGSVAMTLLGTTAESRVLISVIGTRSKSGISPLVFQRINVRSGRVGTIDGLKTADLAGRMSPLKGEVSAIRFDAIGSLAQIDIEGDLAQLTVNRDVSLGPAGSIKISNDVTGTCSITGNVILSGGQIGIGRDLSGALTVGGDVRATGGAQIRVGRDLGTIASSGSASGSSGAGITINGNLTLATGSELEVGRNATSVSIGGNVDTSAGGQIQVDGNLANLTVNGFIHGKGANDIIVGTNLGQLTVLGGGTGGGSLQRVQVEARKNIDGLDVRNGVFNSQIAAGILINAGTPGTGSNGWNIGPDGPLAVFDTQILAGAQIRNLTIGGDVKSDRPMNPAALPTRIVAGEDAQGNFSAGGIIDNFQITGRLIDAVIAASVRPYNGAYPAPGGTIRVGFVGYPPTVLPDYTAPPFENAGITVDALVLPGGVINPGFAPQPLAPNAAQGTPLPVPGKLTILGGVVSTQHGSNADFAGLFAANTSGVIVGQLTA
jgi:hypothetical protein